MVIANRSSFWYQLTTKSLYNYTKFANQKQQQQQEQASGLQLAQARQAAKSKPDTINFAKVYKVKLKQTCSSHKQEIRLQK